MIGEQVGPESEHHLEIDLQDYEAWHRATIADANKATAPCYQLDTTCLLTDQCRCHGFNSDLH